MVGVQGFVSTYYARKKNYKRGKKDATMTSTPFDPDDDDDAEDIVKVLKNAAAKTAAYSFRFFSFWSLSFLYVGLENNRTAKRNPSRTLPFRL